jgi:transposase-like protein
MPWKECSVMDERLQFVARRLAGESMTELCREFGIARKTGYKIFDRYQQCGLQGLTDRSRRPYRYAHHLPSATHLQGREKSGRRREGAPSPCPAYFPLRDFEIAKAFS